MLKNFANLIQIKCMKKYYLLAAVIFSSTVSLKAQQARIGINTDAPKSTLDIRGKTANADGSGTVLNTDITGFQAPRLTRLELTNKGNNLYGADQTGALIYITDISTGDALSQRINITAVGYYYFDGTVWVSVSAGNTGTQTNDWHITGNAGTTAGTNFVGTTDDVDLVFKRNNVVSGALKSTSTSYGVGSLPLTSTGDRNSAFGLNALSVNTTGAANTAVGIRALMDNTTGGGNTAIGTDALSNNVTGFANIAVGSAALFFLASGDRNIGIGNRAIAFANGTNNNVAIGNDALLGISTGNSNTAIGTDSGVNITTGSNNTAIGNGANVPNATGGNQVRIGNAAVTYAGVQVAWTVTSDKRLKSNIKDSDLGLDFIKQLRPVSYIRKNDESKKSEYGFIAQEVKETLKNNGVTNSGIISEADDSTMSVRYNDLIAPMVKALQEQQKLIEDQQAIIIKIQQKVDELGKK